jgi:predicted nuclease of predicted toxin-antitoxin system
LTSRKRSAASSRSKRPDPSPPPVFIDRSLGKFTIATALRAQGVEVHTHDAHFPQDARDEEWLAEVGQRGWVVITKDARIRYRQTELAAVVAGGVKAFVLTRGDLSGAEMAAILERALPRMARFSNRHQAPFIARIAISGKVQILYKPGSGAR